jgi:translation elongation factor EF-Tu-like GTPase
MKPWIIAEVKFFSAEEGGRKQPLILSIGYMPHFRIVGDSEYLGVKFIEAPEGIVITQEAINIKVQLIYYPDVSYQKLVSGESFEIMEGPRVVGKGKVIQVSAPNDFI